MGLFDGTTTTTNTRRRHTADAQHLDITINRDESAAKQSRREKNQPAKHTHNKTQR